MARHRYKTLNGVLSAATRTSQLQVQHDRAKSMSMFAYNYIYCTHLAWAFGVVYPLDRAMRRPEYRDWQSWIPALLLFVFPLISYESLTLSGTSVEQYIMKKTEERKLPAYVPLTVTVVEFRVEGGFAASLEGLA